MSDTCFCVYTFVGMCLCAQACVYWGVFMNVGVMVCVFGCVFVCMCVCMRGMYMYLGGCVIVCVCVCVCYATPIPGTSLHQKLPGE